MKRLLTACFLLSATTAWSQRQEIVLSDNWQFSHDQKSWEQVTVPHDWAISGPFDKKWDLQTVAIEQNGETEATEKSGRSGALPWIGEGYYKRHFSIPSDFNGHAELLFDGAMAEPTVSINGREAGYWAYGYNTFRIDITDFVKPGENLMEVSLKNMEESSRWYPGAGIYRPVTLILTPQQTRIDDWGITTTTKLQARKAKNGADITEFTIELPIADAVGKPIMGMTLIDPDGKNAANLYPVPTTGGTAVGKFYIPNAKLWTPETPYLYKVRATLYDGKSDKNLYDDFGNVIDNKTFTVGLRTVRVSKEGGFQLNGVTRKLRGVCLHHDLGPLGAAVNKAALIRQIKILKEMGCDAIRTAHNMPSQLQMDVCDSLGMMVMAESFDMWARAKCKNGYARFFHEWAERDITNLVKANRNHPSIVMWSIGNEIPEQGSEEGRLISIRLQGLIHSLDPSRPVTQGMDHAEASINCGMAQAMDVPGFNYRVQKYQNSIRQLPQGFLLGSETASTVSSRGIYKFPVEVTDNSRYASWAPGYDPNAIKTADGQCSSYDVEYCSWSNLPDDDWVWQDDYPWVIGEFVWTGFDYLGEPTPYDEYWPSRSSYFGICDLAGLPKDRYWLYRSHWNKDKHTIHLLPHWTWPGRKGQVTPVYCYTDYPEAELFVNGKSQGRIRKTKAGDGRLDRYRLRWNDVKYEPGELKVVVYDEEGKAAGQETRRTAGKPHHLQLDVWTQAGSFYCDGVAVKGDGTVGAAVKGDGAGGAAVKGNGGKSLSGGGAVGGLVADGQDLAFVTVSLEDKNGVLIPDAADQLTFDVQGAGTFRAVCNGDATSLEPFTQPTMKLFSGQLVVVVQAGTEEGNVTLTVTDRQRNLKQKITIPVIK
jgi:beta-galactosidase